MFSIGSDSSVAILLTVMMMKVRMQQLTKMRTRRQVEMLARVVKMMTMTRLSSGPCEWSRGWSKEQSALIKIV